MSFEDEEDQMPEEEGRKGPLRQRKTALHTKSKRHINNGDRKSIQNVQTYLLSCPISKKSLSSALCTKVVLG
jgi:hypothetical protein